MMCEEEKQLYIIRGKCLALECTSSDFYEYIATSDEFKRFTRDAVDIDAIQSGKPTEFPSGMRFFGKVIKQGDSEFEDRAIQGIERVVETPKGKVKIGFTQIRENRIYVFDGEKYFRGIKVFFTDLCLVGAMDYTPLDKSFGDGNIEIIKWNKRTSTKTIKFIHNKLQSILYIVDIEFKTGEDMLLDMENPKELNLSSIIGPLL